MKRTIFSLLVLLGFLMATQAQNTILQARNMPVGSIVTVKGIVTNGPELGPIRYFQDNTAGIAAYGASYGASLNGVNIGDSVTISGRTKLFNQLLEIDTVKSVVIRSSGNPVPAPIVITPGQIGEQYESMLLKVKNVTFADALSVFTGNKKYQFSDLNGQTGFIYVKTGQADIVGQTIPSGLVDITAICSQYEFSNPANGFQLLPRTMADIHKVSSIFFTTLLTNTNFTKTQLDFTWTTNITGTTEMFYGTSQNALSNHISGTGGAVSHSLSITNATPGQIVWVNAFSVTGNDTAFSGVKPFATISNSSGEMKEYFNTEVNTTYSTGVNAIYLHNLIDDTLIQYINRAKYSIDLTMYNFNNDGISNVSNALIAAANRGVVVRVIGCGTTNNTGIDVLVGTAVHVLIGPNSSQRAGIMHNKFILFDTESANPNDPLVWTGSTNLTDTQINTDANNVIILQDQSLARGYKIEFEEMWGSNTATPNPANEHFGSTKKNNTPHEYKINGKRVESYFSPTDGVNAKIVQTINTSNNDLSIATMLITRTEMADAIVARKSANVAANVLTNNAANNNTTVNTTLTTALGTHFVASSILPGIMHNKYMVVDQGAPASDPLVLTGSHNWSAGADNDNDENTLIIHDATIANIYYQNFVKIFVGNNGVLGELTTPPTAVNDSVTVDSAMLVTVKVLNNDIIQAPINMTIASQPAHGSAYKPFTNPNAITYSPESGYKGLDSFTYTISYQAKPTFSSTATVVVKVVKPNDINEIPEMSQAFVYPNPSKDGNLNLSFYLTNADNGKLQLFDLAGKLVFESNTSLARGQNILHHSFPTTFKGAYLLKLTTSKTVWNQKVIFE